MYVFIKVRKVHGWLISFRAYTNNHVLLRTAREIYFFYEVGKRGEKKEKEKSKKRKEKVDRGIPDFPGKHVSSALLWTITFIELNLNSVLSKKSLIFVWKHLKTRNNYNI